MFWESFQIYGVKITGNEFLIQNIESTHFYSCPQATLLPGSYHHPSRRTKLSISPRQYFLEIYFPPAEWGEGKETMGLKNDQN